MLDDPTLNPLTANPFQITISFNFTRKDAKKPRRKEAKIARGGSSFRRSDCYFKLKVKAGKESGRSA